MIDKQIELRAYTYHWRWLPSFKCISGRLSNMLGSRNSHETSKNRTQLNSPENQLWASSTWSLLRS